MRPRVVLGLISIALVTPVVPAAAASELISIPVDRVVRGDPGEEILVASAEVPEELQGLGCEMFGETNNQESVHEGNDLIIRFDGQTRVVPNFEDERNIRYEFREIAALAARIDVYVRLGPDGVSSGGFLISIECDREPPPTTTPTTTTVEPPTTTAEPPPTTTILPPPASSVPPTLPPTTLPPTTLPPTTLPPTLAVTGGSAAGPAVIGLVLLLGGALVLAVVARRAQPEERSRP